MVNFLRRKATESIDYAIGAALIVQRIVIGSVFSFFANMLINSESQTPFEISINLNNTLVL